MIYSKEMDWAGCNTINCLMFSSERSAVCGTLPLSYLNLNLPHPADGQDSLLTVEDLNKLFYQVYAELPPENNS